MSTIYQSGQKFECTSCNKLSMLSVENHTFEHNNNKAFDNCEHCGKPFSIIKKQNEEYSVDFNDQEAHEHFSQYDFYFDPYLEGSDLD